MSHFAVHLRNSPVKLASFRGNRFNISFWNAACVLFHQRHFMSFFDIYGTPNNLLQAVQEDLNEIKNIAGCRALGVIDKLVTGPYWRKCETVENILDLNPVIEEIQRNCLSWSEDSSTLLFDQKPGFEGADVHKDEVYNALFAPQSEQLDQFTQIALEIIMGNFCLTIARQMESVLEGNLHNPSDELREETKNAPTTNAASERVFSSFDRLIRERPHATTLNLESTILFETNQTAAWLSGLDDSTKKHYMEIARKSAKNVLKDYQKRRMDIEERIRREMLVKQKKHKKRNKMP